MRTLRDVRRGRIRKHNPVNSNDVVLEDAVSVEDLKKAVVEWLPHLGVKFDLLSARDWIVEFFELEGGGMNVSVDYSKGKDKTVKVYWTEKDGKYFIHDIEVDE